MTSSLSTTPQASLEIARKVSNEAAVLALQLFSRGTSLRVTTKNPQDFVTEADRRVEALIRRQLAVLSPGVPVLGEEGGGEAGPDYWVVDPIDGTANYIRGNPLWGICIARMRAGRPVAGVMAFPALAMTLSAAEGCGAWHGGERIARGGDQHPACVVALGEGARWASEDICALISDLRAAEWGIAIYRCASVGLAYAALGRVDGFIERHLGQWDIAAGIIICREAGLSARYVLGPGLGESHAEVGTDTLLSLLRDRSGVPTDIV